MTRYRVQVTGHIEADGEELAVTLVREILGDDLDLTAQGLALEVVATEVPDEAMKRPTRCCYWCGSRFRSTPGPDSQGQRYCSSECSIDSKNLSEER
jgi:hypothetical protein